MIFTMTKQGKPQPPTMPCGCAVVRNLKAIGLDGAPVQGLTGLNSKTGWMRVQRCVVFPGLLRRDPRTGRALTTEQGLQPIQVTAPFELRCKVHGRLHEPEEHEGHGRPSREGGPEDPDCPCRGTDARQFCARYGCGFCLAELSKKEAKP